MFIYICIHIFEIHTNTLKKSVFEFSSSLLKHKRKLSKKNGNFL